MITSYSGSSCSSSKPSSIITSTLLLDPDELASSVALEPPALELSPPDEADGIFRETPLIVKFWSSTVFLSALGTDISVWISSIFLKRWSMELWFTSFWELEYENASNSERLLSGCAGFFTLIAFIFVYEYSF